MPKCGKIPNGQRIWVRIHSIHMTNTTSGRPWSCSANTATCGKVGFYFAFYSFWNFFFLLFFPKTQRAVDSLSNCQFYSCRQASYIMCNTIILLLCQIRLHYHYYYIVWSSHGLTASFFFSLSPPAKPQWNNFFFSTAASPGGCLPFSAWINSI